MKFTLYCTITQSDGKILRFVRHFDSLRYVMDFIYNYRLVLNRDWKLVQNNTRTTDVELKQLYYDDSQECEYPSLPF